MLPHRYNENLDKAYNVLQNTESSSCCYDLCIKFAQSLVLRLGEKILSIDARINLFSLMALVAAKNPSFKWVYFSPF